MIVVSDTSPITNLIQIGQLNLLHRLYQEIILPPAVFTELAFLDNQKALLEKEDWIRPQALTESSMLPGLLLRVDKGEAEAIALALELKADFLLIDEQIGRNVAEEYGLKITGILGVLVKAKSEGLILEVKPMLNKLKTVAGFRIHSKLVEHILKVVGE